MNKEKERVSLGLKQKMANPWDNIEAKFPVGRRSRARSSASCPTARLCSSNPAWKVSFMSPNFPGPSAWPNPATSSSRIRNSKPSSSASTATNRKFPSASASWKAIRGTAPTAKYTVGTKVKGKVRNLTSYGAFVELEEGIDGMVHVSDMSWTRKINHPSEMLKKGDEVEATVLEVDKRQPAHRARHEAARN